MTTARPDTVASSADTLVPWINRSLEALWLLTVVLVPLAFLDRDYLVSEAVIAYVEVPKVALLRTLASLMAVLWLIEWGVRGRFPPGFLLTREGAALRPGAWLARLRGWLRNQPTRWLTLAVWFYLATTILTTFLSASLSVSLWGEIPGQDSYPLYTVLAYAVVFGVITTHLKTRPQLWRLLGAIVVMGTLVAGNAVLQHYGHDFFNLSEPSGGTITSFMGNTIFAAAVMMMSIPISLAVAIITLPDAASTAANLRLKVTQWAPTLVASGLWGMLLTIQLLGITFTMSRGPWIGTAAALVISVSLVAVLGGWRHFGRAVALLGFPSLVTIAVANWALPLSSPVLWLGATLGPVAVLVVAAVIGWRNLGRSAVVTGVTLVVVGGFLFMPGWVGSTFSSQIAQQDSGASAADAQLGSVKSDVLGRTLGGRLTHWKVSWQLIRDHPWAEFSQLSLPWLRPVIGYGPDLFRYTYLLRSPPEGNNLFPLEPDHAHNFFIHQTVEQGYLGLLSSLGIFAAVALAGGYRLWWQRQHLSLVDKLLFAILLATLSGRFLEMMVGVARVSDLTILWVILAMFAALPTVMQNSPIETAETPPIGATRRRQSRRARRSVVGSAGSILEWRRFWSMAIVAVIIGGIVVLTWVKNVNYVRAGVAEADAVQQFRRFDWQESLASSDRAIKLAPDVPIYYNNKAQIYLAYLLNPETTREQECGFQDERPYDNCLAVQSFTNNSEGVAHRPLSYRTRLALANSAFNLTLHDEAIRFYAEGLALVPRSWSIRNELADIYIDAGRPEDALEPLRASLAITQGRDLSAAAFFLLGKAYRDLGSLNESAIAFENGLVLASFTDPAESAFQDLAEVYGALGQPDKAADALARLQVDPRVQQARHVLADGYVRQARTYLDTGQLEKSALLLERSLELGFGSDGAERRTDELLGEVYAALGRHEEAARAFFLLAVEYSNLGNMEKSIDLLQRGADASALSAQAELVGGALLLRGVDRRDVNLLEKSAQSLERSLEVIGDPSILQQARNALAVAYVLQARTYLDARQLEKSVLFLERSLELGFSSAGAERGARQLLEEVYTEMGRPS